MKYAVSAAISSPDYQQQSAHKKRITSRPNSGLDVVICLLDRDYSIIFAGIFLSIQQISNTVTQVRGDL